MAAAVQDLQDESWKLAMLLQEQERALWLLSNQRFDDDDDGDVGGHDGFGARADGGDGAGVAGEEEDISDEELARRLQDEADREAYDALYGPPPGAEEGEPGVEVESLTYEELTALGEVVGTVPKGASAEVVGALPTASFAALAAAGRATLDKCCICQVEFGQEDCVTLLPCAHYYHPECVAQWLALNKTCCICNKEIPTGGGANDAATATIESPVRLGRPVACPVGTAGGKGGCAHS